MTNINPLREKAVDILELINKKCEVDLCGLTWYDLEDMIVDILLVDKGREENN